MNEKKSNMLNIPSTIEDSFYRYKMPRLQLKVEAKGNGIKTNLLNLVEVAKALRVPTEYTLKFLGHELGSQTIYKEKGNEITTVIKGTFPEELFKTTLDKFIEKYICCQKCKYPEMILSVKKGLISGRCNACGHKNDIDNVHKLAAFIVKNPPGNQTELKKGAEGKNGKKTTDTKKEKVPVIVPTDKPNESSSKTKLKENEEESKKIEVNSDEEDSKGKSEAKNDDYNIDSKKIEQAIDVLRKTYYEISDSNDNTKKPDNVDKFFAIFRGLCLDVSLEDRLVYVIFNAVFDVNVAKQISKNSSLLKLLFNKIPIKLSELHLLITMEHFLLEQHKESGFEKFIPTILKMFYDEDLLSEEFLLAWDEGTYKNSKAINFLFKEDLDEKFKTHSQPILTWLKNNAGEEDEEEEQQETEKQN